MCSLNEIAAYYEITKEENLKKEIIQYKKRIKTSLSDSEFIIELKNFYKFIFENEAISLTSSNLYKYRRGWFMKHENLLNDKKEKGLINE